MGSKLTDATELDEILRHWLSEVTSQYPAKVWVLACEMTLKRWATERNQSDPNAEITKETARIVFGIRLLPSMI